MQAHTRTPTQYAQVRGGPLSRSRSHGGGASESLARNRRGTCPLYMHTVRSRLHQVLSGMAMFTQHVHVPVFVAKVVADAAAACAGTNGHVLLAGWILVQVVHWPSPQSRFYRSRTPPAHPGTPRHPTTTHVPANKKGDCVAIGMLNADACLINDMLDVAVSPRGDTDATAGATLGSKEVATSKASNSGLNQGTRL